MHELRSTSQPEQSSSGVNEFVEGRARLILPAQAENRPGVFYNPKMNLNRDIAILFALSHFPSPRQLYFCDPMTGSGVRAVRYLLETPNVLSVLAADNEPQTVEIARATARLNGLEERILIVESDANLLLLNHATEGFDLVDLDPFGSPAPFLENALRATLDRGVVAATATDMAPLTGARASACVRKYGVRPIRTEFEKEMAVRILAACIAMIAGRLELGIDIAFSHASDHYARIYAKVTKGRKSANLSARSLGFLEYCPECLRRSAHSKLESIRASCEDCGGRTRIGGPVWLGPIWDGHTVRGMIERTPMLQSSRLSEIQNILTSTSQEHEASAFHYRTDTLSRRLGLKPPAVNEVLNALQDAGFEATRTHFSPNGFRTNASSREIAQMLRDSTKES
jgi:tRNA (guanine26-N2/guanine27-N2)-dimethyltransferase